MAEVLILLLFVLLLALTHRLQVLAVEVSSSRLQAAEANRTIQAASDILAAHGVEGAKARELLTRVAAEEDAKARAKQLEGELATRDEALLDWKVVSSAAQRIRPEDPPAATLRRGLDSLSSDPPNDTEQRSALLANLEDRARQIDPEAPPHDTLRRALEQVRTTRTVSGVWVAVRDNERKLAAQIRTEFSQDLGRWNASLDDAALTVRFQNPELLFEQGKAELQESFKALLRDFFPRYMRVLMAFADGIEEVRIEGHTSSEWRTASDPMERYFSNMELSQNRTRSVLRFSMTQTQIPLETRNWARGRITANGLAFSKLLTTQDGREDPERSRRVEFRVLMKLREQLLANSTD